ncbi:uncharacterized protein [Pleurodeles waltl]|uniref:uncharacterized protein n=1 Tax=Pleurodeles waltl TaxID=8319 RepID=UPI003709426C
MAGNMKGRAQTGDAEHLLLKDCQESGEPPVQMETVQQGYDAELRCAIASLQQILHVQEGSSTLSQDNVSAGAPMDEASRDMDGKLKKQPRKRKSPGSKDGPPIKKGPSSRKNHESSHQSSGDACPQPKPRMSSLKVYTGTVQNPTKSSVLVSQPEHRDPPCNISTSVAPGPGTTHNDTTSSIIKGIPSTAGTSATTIQGLGCDHPDIIVLTTPSAQLIAPCEASGGSPKQCSNPKINRLSLKNRRKKFQNPEQQSGPLDLSFKNFVEVQPAPPRVQSSNTGVPGLDLTSPGCTTIPAVLCDPSMENDHPAEDPYSHCIELLKALAGTTQSSEAPASPCLMSPDTPPGAYDPTSPAPSARAQWSSPSSSIYPDSSIGCSGTQNQSFGTPSSDDQGSQTPGCSHWNPVFTSRSDPSAVIGGDNNGRCPITGDAQGVGNHPSSVTSTFLETNLSSRARVLDNYVKEIHHSFRQLKCQLHLKTLKLCKNDELETPPERFVVCCRTLTTETHGV